MKTHWVTYPKDDVHVTLACLARVSYGESSEHKVALCLRADGAERRTLAERVISDFRILFKEDRKPRHHIPVGRTAGETSFGGQAFLQAACASNVGSDF
jgi:hypothetical protein